MSDSARKPVRLKIAYESPKRLVAEYTKSVGQGGVAIESRRALPIGTKFVFELHAKGVDAPVEVNGEVVGVETLPTGGYRLNVNYAASGDNARIASVLTKIFDAQRFEKVRKHPRIPIRLAAAEVGKRQTRFAVRDISRGGLGLEVEDAAMPAHVTIGETFLLTLQVSLGELLLYGEVAWIFSPPAERARVLKPGFGVRFGKLRADTLGHLDTILKLQGLPPPPWNATIRFGMDAVAAMP